MLWDQQKAITKSYFPSLCFSCTTSDPTAFRAAFYQRTQPNTTHPKHGSHTNYCLTPTSSPQALLKHPSCAVSSRFQPFEALYGHVCLPSKQRAAGSTDSAEAWRPAQHWARQGSMASLRPAPLGLRERLWKARPRPGEELCAFISLFLKEH